VPGRRHIRSFYLVIVDDDQRIFTVEGPMTDDTHWTHSVYLAQKAGRNVRCSSAEHPSADHAAAEWQRHYPHDRRPPGSIVQEALGRR